MPDLTIYLYSGTPGSGKSLHAARDIYYRLRSDKPVITNFEINLPAVRKDTSKISHFLYLPNEQMTPDAVMSFAKAFWGGSRPREGTIRLYLDECQLLFNSRDYRASDRMKWIKLFSQHRKLGIDVYLIAQFDRMIDRQIRALIEYEYNHRKLSNFGHLGAIIKVIALGDIFVSMKFYYPIGELVERSFFRSHKRYTALYDTFALFD